MIRALFRKQLQELFAAFVRSGRSGRRRTRGQRVGYAALFLALLLVLTMILSGCSLIVKDEAVDAARVVIRVGDDTYTKAQVQAQMAKYLEELGL